MWQVFAGRHGKAGFNGVALNQPDCPLESSINNGLQAPADNINGNGTEFALQGVDK